VYPADKKELKKKISTKRKKIVQSTEFKVQEENLRGLSQVYASEQGELRRTGTVPCKSSNLCVLGVLARY